MTRALILIAIAASVQSLPAQTRHYVFFGFEREHIRSDSLFMNTKAAEGAQILYSWRALERGKGEYDFATIRDDLAFLQSKGKRLWVQLQDVSFSPIRKHVPQYLLDDPAYHGGAAQQFETQGDNDSVAVAAGWVARRWDPAVQERFHALLHALGREFDGRIEGINLAETAIGFGSSGRYFPAGFTHDAYRAAIVTNFKALRKAFPRSVAMQYANFIPGEWRPYRDKGYLTGIYDSAKVYRVGVGGPDLMPSRPGQMKSSYPLIRDAAGIVPTGLAVQDGNLEEINPATKKPVTAAELIEFARSYLKLDYIFWGTQEPYYSRDVIPTLRRIP
jgi:hypothetical protein